MNFVIEIASVPDRDELVAEIWLADEMVAEVQRKPLGDFRIEIYAHESSEPWSFELQQWLQALIDARDRLS